ncbi:non-ribosomal peptide synthetase [Streptomyces rubradiris]|uniref:non-ribosomal peptide synthetase n=1 Tax=Streptomyces rubradiris TaxID=285531 RepID=UPI001673AC92|nr:non-ribosomal peptide synthetase [Streptomyces rubradiris]
MVLNEFHVRVAEAPDAVAVQDGDLRLTYRNLAAHASALASELTGRGVGQDSVVAVYADRSAELVVAELAVLLAGGAYLPLDPAHPAARVRQLLQDSGAVAVLSTAPLVSGGAPLGDDVLLVDLTEEPSPATASVPPGPNGAALAYVIYTSGSTGRPKGVAVTHASLANLMHWHHKTYGTRPQDRSTLLASPGFDVSVQDIWFTLTAGATLVVPPAEVRASPSALAAWLADEQITVSFLPTPLAEAVLDEAWPAHTVLRYLHTGGSAMQRGVPEGLPFTVINLYGPTEATVKVTAGEVVPEGPVPPPIGVPVDGVRCYVLDGLDPVPDGEVGELCLGGACVARGYLHDPASTAAVFVPDIGAPGERMYRTGDKVRRRPDGVFEYIGRYDDQAKIRGFRIEPGEVATVLKQHPGVRDAFVVVEHSGRPDARLVAYAVTGVPTTELVEFVAARLPGYMVPAAVVVLPALPLTPNGKVDRAALPAPGRTAAGLADTAVPPRTPTEAALARIVAGLLGGTEVGVHDDFFALGGNSLLVAGLAARITAELHTVVSVPELFGAPTVADLAAIIDQRAAAAGNNGPEPAAQVIAPTAPPVRRADRNRPIPLSLPQERVWFFEQLSPGNLAYNFQATVSLRGEVDVDALRAALDEIVRRHEILRTAFVSVDGVGYQRPLAQAKAPLKVLDVPAEQADEVVAAHLREPFDLTEPPLARWVLLRHGNGHNTFLHVEHHFVHDGWSLSVFLSELRALYPAFAAGQPSPLPELAVQYADYAIWQRDWMRGDVLRTHVDHWTARLAGAPHTLELPADRPRPPVMTFRGRAPRIRIPAELARRLRAFSRDNRVSLFSTMYAGFAALLYRYTGQRDMLVGTGAANRNVPELEPLLGMLVNTLVMRTKVSADQSFSDLLAQVRQSVAETLAWSDTPVDAVIDAIDPVRDPSRTPLFQVMFSFHDSAVPDIDFGGLTGKVTERSNNSAKADLNVIVIPRAEQRLGRAPRPEDDDLAMIWEHSADLFDQATMERMVTHYLTLLADAVARPQTRVGTLRLLPDEEAAQLESWSHGPAAAGTRPVTELIAQQVRTRPDAVAVRWPEGQLSYGQLWQRAGALARRLRASGIAAEEPVAVYADRSPELVVGELAVLMAGGCYLPLDPDYPAERVAFIVRDAGARTILTTPRTRQQLPAFAQSLDVLGLDADTDTDTDTAPVHADQLTPERLAYLIYTSGSTGRPKGVALEHRGLANLVAWHTAEYALGPADRSTLFASPGFDASTWEIWPTLAAGATLHVVPPHLRAAPAELVRWLGEQKITTAFLPTPVAAAALDEPWPADSALRALLTGGDVLPAAPSDGLPFQLFNHYGPTENTVVATAGLVPPAPAGPRPPIGRPISGVDAHVLDAEGQPVPIGVRGELYLGGTAVARGYVNRPELTEQSFLADPFTARPGARLYRTGDLVRRRADGELDFLGRADEQVKIRGFRIEPGEVAATLREHPDVRDAVVVARASAPGAEASLTAYVCTDGRGETTSGDKLLAFLRDRLPVYMIPDGIVLLPALPLTEHGKVDHDALAALAPSTPARPPTRQAPRTPTEERVARLASALLHDQPVGRTDDFFRAGGHSLLAARLVAQVNEAFDVQVPISAFLQRPTVASLADAVTAATTGAATGPAPITPRNRRIAVRPVSEAGRPGDEEGESLLRDTQEPEVQQ